MVEEVFFLRYVNSDEFKIDGSDLIRTPCAPMSYACAPDMFPI
jgi:hypothetical protein